MAEVKFCGLTRGVDAALGASLGAAYLGVIFASGPRLRSASEARALFEAAASAGAARRVGVFGSQSAADIISTARDAGLDVVQLHEAGDPAVVREIRRHFGGEVWRVLRLPRSLQDAPGDATRLARRELPPRARRDSVADAAYVAALQICDEGVDALVVDALVPGVTGGTGVALDWELLAAAIDRAGRPKRLVLAGGLRPDNVGRAMALVAPDVVDVSSGVESAPGIKDHGMMRVFAAAAARGGQ